MRIVVGCCAVFVLALLAAPASEASLCWPVRIDLDGTVFPCEESPGGLCSDRVIGRGILKGTKFAVYTDAAPSAGLPASEPPEVLSYTADAVFTTRFGELHLRQLGISDPSREVFTELNRVQGGTGLFRNATGDLFISGTTSLGGTQFESEITGEICLGAD